MPALFLGVLVAGCVWCCTREKGDRTHPATMLANFKRGVKRVKRQFRPNVEPQDDVSYYHSRARNQLIEAGMTARQAIRAIDLAYDTFSAANEDIQKVNGRDLAARAYSLRDKVLQGKTLPDVPPVRFVMNGRSWKRCRPKPRRCPSDRAGTITWLAEQMCVSKAKAKHLLDTYGGPKRSRPSPNAVEHIAETYPEFGESGLKKWKFREPSTMGPRKGGSRRSRRNGRSWNDQNLTGHSWSTSRTPDGGSVTVHRDASGRVVERDVLSGKQHATKMKGVRDRMSKRSSGAVAILVRQGVSKTAAKRAVDFVGADSSDTASELASRARTVLGGGGRVRRPKQSLRRAFVSGAVRHKPMEYRRAAKRRRNRGRR